MLERHGSLVGGGDVYFPSLRAPNPIAELNGIGSSRGKENEVDAVREHNDHFLPHHPSLRIVHVVHLVEDDPLYVSDGVAAAIQHAAQDLSGHNQTVCLWVHTHVPRYQSHLRVSVHTNA